MSLNAAAAVRFRLLRDGAATALFGALRQHERDDNVFHFAAAALRRIVARAVRDGRIAEPPALPSAGSAWTDELRQRAS